MGIIIVISGFFSLLLSGSSLYYSINRLLTSKNQFIGLIFISILLFIIEIVFSLIQLKNTVEANAFDFHFTLITFCVWQSIISHLIGLTPYLFLKQASVVLASAALLSLVSAFITLLLPIYHWLGVKTTY